MKINRIAIIVVLFVLTLTISTTAFAMGCLAPATCGNQGEEACMTTTECETDCPKSDCKAAGVCTAMADCEATGASCGMMPRSMNGGCGMKMQKSGCGMKMSAGCGMMG